MKAFFGAGDASTALRLLSGKHMMVSYAYMGDDKGGWLPKKGLAKLVEAAASVAVDSGAFTEWNRSKTGKKTAGITVEKYTEWLISEALPYCWACAFDVIGDAEASAANWRMMMRCCPPPVAARIVPVWHEGDPIEILEEYDPDARLVALGRTRGRGSEVKTLAFYDDAFNAFPDGRFHLLGNSNPITLEPYPAESFDSVTWQKNATYDSSHGWPLNRCTKEIRMKAYIEAIETIRHRVSRQRELVMG